LEELESLRIVSLGDERALLRSLACLHHEEWSRVSPFKTIAEHEKKLSFRISAHPPPATYVLLVEGEVAGSVSLLKHDDIANIRPDLSPWLASLLVVPKFRGLRYGRKLIAYCADRARALGSPTLYLYTNTHPDYYERLGWRAIERLMVRGAEATVMELPLSPRTTNQVS
jgi:predicted N-acetyltransferase YhbS